MSSKQDRAAPRTVADIERKYNFGKSFAEVIGMINDTREEVDEAYSELNDVKEQTSTLSRTTTELEATFQTVIDDGVSRVVTKTGYVFDSEGLKISKSGEQMTNLLDNTGMYVKRSGADVLAANDEGVVALDLHAKNRERSDGGGAPRHPVHKRRDGDDTNAACPHTERPPCP